MSARSAKLKHILPLLRPFRRRILLIVGMTVALSILAMLPPLLVRQLIDQVSNRHGIRYLPPLLIAALLLTPLLTTLMAFLQTLAIAIVGQCFVHRLRNHLWQHLLSLPMNFFSRHSVGMLVNRTMGDSGVVQQILTSQSIGILSDLVCATFALSVTFAINWRLALVMLVIVALFVGNYRLNIGKIRDTTRLHQGAHDRLAGSIQNRLGGMIAVKTFGMENREQLEFEDLHHSGQALVEQAMHANNRFNLNNQLINQGGSSLLYFLGCLLVIHDQLTYGQVIAFTAYASQLLWPAVRFSMIAKQLQDVGIALDRLVELLDEPRDIADAPQAVSLNRLQGEVRFVDVDFAYDPGKPVLRQLNLEVRPGMTVALIGPTGCGKSTILSLVMRFYDVSSGCLYLDGHDIRNIALHSLRRQFGIVLQEPLLFDISIADNIRYGRPDASLAAVRAAAQTAEIDTFIAALPQGYDTMLGADGLELSLGQRQRLTIARAVLADPAILVMDEATSALDSESEHAIQRAMDKVLRNRTCFIVAHRLSTIRNADLIVLLQDGRIAEQGQHDQLMQRPDGHYRRLYLTHMGQGHLGDA